MGNDEGTGAGYMHKTSHTTRSQHHGSHTGGCSSVGAGIQGIMAGKMVAQTMQVDHPLVIGPAAGDENPCHPRPQEPQVHLQVCERVGEGAAQGERWDALSLTKLWFSFSSTSGKTILRISAARLGWIRV